jgi:hypothetical protein
MASEKDVTELARLPFMITDIYAGFAKIHGIMIVTPERLLFEYQMSDNVFGAIAGRITKRSVNFGDLEKVERKTGFFAPRVNLTAKRLETFSKFPHRDPSIFQIRVSWKNRKLIRPALAEIELHLSYVEADRFRERLGGMEGGGD